MQDEELEFEDNLIQLEDEDGNPTSFEFTQLNITKYCTGSKIPKQADVFITSACCFLYKMMRKRYFAFPSRLPFSSTSAKSTFPLLTSILVHCTRTVSPRR